MIGWRGLVGRRVGVWGVGVEGTATLARLAVEGVEPVVIVAPSAGTTGGHEVVALDDGGVALLQGCDVVVKSPGISPYDEPAQAVAGAGVQITSGLALWLEDAPRERVACITGTKGKSTTTALAGAIARGLGQQVFVGGNLGSPPWAPDTPDADWYLVETSSYQAHDLTVGPRVAAVTSLSADHLTWHHGYDAYVRDKLSVCTLPGVEVVLAPEGDAELRRYDALLGPHVQFVAESTSESDAAWLDELHLLGRHNLRNALLAREVLLALGVPGSDDPVRVRAAAASYEPLPSRMTPVGSIDGVAFVDDSLSTNTLPTLAAVDAFAGRRAALLVGGQDRGIDYAPLARGLRGRAAPVRVFALPDNGPRISATLRAEAPEVEVEDAADLRSAVAAAYTWARPDGVVLLSPAAPSFGVFRDYAERAEAFVAAMQELANADG
ncbi:MAG: UDP-N-acetylmuramoyl-L-alanine--D-glutamate ligase [Nocardioides sp.]